ncbi:MAG: mannose-6-phosphate isomerase, class I [Spirochaetes bacterium]|nr:mannose-6-phosphate isomerase, class I [Spirochaetota bacterium]
MEKNISQIIDQFILNPYPVKLDSQIMDENHGYYWGDKKFIPNFFGFENKDNISFAEAWFGIHPKAPSSVKIADQQISLLDLISFGKEKILGSMTYQQHQTLPFLVKVLSAHDPLSLQVHPNKQQAKRGFLKEEGKGPNYKDKNHKPEIVYTLTPFEALMGFRDIQDIIQQFSDFQIKQFKPFLNTLTQQSNGAGDDEEKKQDALKQFFYSLMNLEERKTKKVIKKLKKIAIKRFSYYPNIHSYEYWVLKCLENNKSAVKKEIANGKLKPEEKKTKLIQANRGIIIIYLLNLVLFQPGTIVYTPAGKIHAYLKGSCVEVMANSDNVLRGGLTHKHIDVEELLNILDFQSKGPAYLNANILGENEKEYTTVEKDFKTRIISLKENQKVGLSALSEAAVVLVVQGQVEMNWVNERNEVVKKGDAYLIPCGVNTCTFRAQSEESIIVLVTTG